MYSNRLGRGGIASKLKYSALGKRIPDILERQKQLMKKSVYMQLCQSYKQTDWALTPIYQ